MGLILLMATALVIGSEGINVPLNLGTQALSIFAFAKNAAAVDRLIPQPSGQQLGTMQFQKASLIKETTRTLF